MPTELDDCWGHVAGPDERPEPVECECGELLDTEDTDAGERVCLPCRVIS